MIAANYTADFYCDSCHSSTTGELLREADYYDKNTLEVVYQTWGECVAAARKLGWKVSRDRRYCICPLCVKEGIKLSDVRYGD